MKTAGALCRRDKCLLRGLQQAAERVSQHREQRRERKRDAYEQTDRAADDAPGFIGFSFADLLAQQDGYARRQSDEQRCDQLHGLTAGRDGGDIRRAREFSDDDQIDRAVHRL